ncbi:hypothetical protein JTB14_033842 [Gonioctena quinquepunctata]|nr:hypothetical protein JTB14_033842 [Gonioctena quinquepunctata]
MNLLRALPILQVSDAVRTKRALGSSSLNKKSRLVGITSTEVPRDSANGLGVDKCSSSILLHELSNLGGAVLVSSTDEKFQLLLDVCLETKSMVNQIMNAMGKEDFAGRKSKFLRDDKIRDRFPLANLDQLLEVEKQIQLDVEFENQLFHHLRLIGGSDIKNLDTSNSIHHSNERFGNEVFLDRPKTKLQGSGPEDHRSVQKCS